MAQTEMTLTVDTTSVDEWVEWLKSNVKDNAALLAEIEALMDGGDPLWDVEPATLVAGVLMFKVVARAPLVGLLDKHEVPNGPPT